MARGRPSLALVALALVVGCGEQGGEETGAPSAPSPVTVAVEPPPCDLYAANGGSDARGDGSRAHPWEHVDFLVGRLRDEDGRRVGCLRSGTFTPTGVDETGGEPALRFDAPGVTLTSEPGERARVVGRIYVSDHADGVTIAGLDLAMQSNRYPGTTCTGDCGNSSFPIAGAGVTVSGNDITNDGTDICLQLIDNGSGSADDAVVVGNRIHDCGPSMPRSNTAHAIYVNDSAGSRISQNLIYDNGAFGVKLGPRAVGAAVTGNVIDFNGVGVLVGDQPPCPPSDEASRDNLIAANVVTRSQARNNIEGYWATPEDDPSCFEIGGDARGNVVSGNCTYADNPESDGPEDFYNLNGGIGLRDPAVPQSGGFLDDGTNVAIAPSAQPVMPPIYADPVNGGYHLRSAEGGDCLEAGEVTDAAAVANSRWRAPVALASGEAPAVAVAPDGAAATAQIAAGAVRAVVREPGAQTGPTRWDPANPSALRPDAERISSVGEGASEVRIGAGGSGRERTFVAAWLRGGSAVEAALWRDGEWTSPVGLGRSGADAGAPALAVGADGAAVVAWRRGGTISASTLAAGSVSFAAPQTLATGAAGDPRVAAGADGGAVAVWSAAEDGGRVIEAATFEGLRWSQPQRLSAPGGDADQPDVAASGDAVVAVWRRLDGADRIAEASVLQPDGGWVEPSALSAPGAGVAEPSVGVSADGGAVAAWSGDHGVETAARPAEGAFGVAERISAPGPAADARVAVGPDGSAIIAWSAPDADAGYRRVFAAARAPGAPWGPVQGLSTVAPGAIASRPSPAVGVAGSGIVVWGEGGATVFGGEFWF